MRNYGYDNTNPNPLKSVELLPSGSFKLCIGKPVNNKTAYSGGGFVDLKDVLSYSNKLGSNIYSSTPSTIDDNGITNGIMLWAFSSIGISSLNAPLVSDTTSDDYPGGLWYALPHYTIKNNKTLVFLYMDSYNIILPTKANNYTWAPPIFQLINVLDSTNNHYINDIPQSVTIPGSYGKNMSIILAFADCGSRDAQVFSDLTNTWGTSNDNVYWKGSSTSLPLNWKKTPTSFYNSTIPTFVQLKNGAAGSWVKDASRSQYSIKPVDRLTKVMISFGGANVPMGQIVKNGNPQVLAQQLVNIVIKYGFDGVDFDLENFDKKVTSIVFTSKLYYWTKTYFTELENYITENPNSTLAKYYGSTYKFIITDAPQPEYFQNSYWNNNDSTDEAAANVDICANPLS
jgi:hypothetical protein